MENNNYQSTGSNPTNFNPVESGGIGSSSQASGGNDHNIRCAVLHNDNETCNYYPTDSAPYDPNTTAPFNVAAFLEYLNNREGEGSTPNDASTNNSDDAAAYDGNYATTDNRNYETANDDYNDPAYD